MRLFCWPHKWKLIDFDVVSVFSRYDDGELSQTPYRRYTKTMWKCELCGKLKERTFSGNRDRVFRKMLYGETVEPPKEQP